MKFLSFDNWKSMNLKNYVGEMCSNVTVGEWNQEYLKAGFLLLAVLSTCNSPDYKKLCFTLQQASLCWLTSEAVVQLCLLRCSKSFGIFLGKCTWWSLLLVKFATVEKLNSTTIFGALFRNIQNIKFSEHLLATASVSWLRAIMKAHVKVNSNEARILD